MDPLQQRHPGAHQLFQGEDKVDQQAAPVTAQAKAFAPVVAAAPVGEQLQVHLAYPQVEIQLVGGADPALVDQGEFV